MNLNGDRFQACTVGSLNWSELRHYHYDVFEWYLPDFDYWMKIRFLTDENGEISSVSIPIEPAVENIVFTRKQPELSEEIIHQLVGEYVTEIDGLAFTVTAHEGKIYIAQTGAAAKEAKPYKFNNASVGLKLERNRFDFMRENEAYPRMVLKMPDSTLEAVRK